MQNAASGLLSSTRLVLWHLQACLLAVACLPNIQDALSARLPKATTSVAVTTGCMQFPLRNASASVCEATNTLQQAVSAGSEAAIDMLPSGNTP